MVTEIDLRAGRPARQQFRQDAGRGRFADRDRTGDADDERRLDRVVDIEEALALLEQDLRGLDMGGQQPRQRQINAADLVEIDRIVERAQPA